MTEQNAPSAMGATGAEPPPLTGTVPVPPPMVLRPGRRTPLAAIAGAILLVLGLLGGILGLFVIFVGSTFVSTLRGYIQVPDLGGADAGSVIGGFVAFFGVLIAFYSLVYILGGVGVLRTAGWGRTLGLIVGIISGLVWLSGFSNMGEISNGNNGVGTLVMLALHVYVVVVLLFFWKGKPTPA
jgi:hypothetical protein